METKEEKNSYITDRLENYYNWYNQKAKKCKRRYLFVSSASAISAVLIPVLNNMSFSGHNNFVTVLGVIVASLVALESVFHYREQWVNSRSTASYIFSQKVLYTYKAEPYSKLSAEDAFQKLVENVEKAIEKETAVTLKVLSRIEESKTASAKQGA